MIVNGWLDTVINWHQRVWPVIFKGTLVASYTSSIWQNTFVILNWSHLILETENEIKLFLVPVNHQHPLQVWESIWIKRIFSQSSKHPAWVELFWMLLPLKNSTGTTLPQHATFFTSDVLSRLYLHVAVVVNWWLNDVVYQNQGLANHHSKGCLLFWCYLSAVSCL